MVSCNLSAIKMTMGTVPIVIFFAKKTFSLKSLLTLIMYLKNDFVIINLNVAKHYLLK